MAIATVGVVAAGSLPWPANDEFEFPGHPAILDGAWFGQAPDAQRPHIVLSKDGQTVSNRRNADSSVTILGYTITSYTCVDDNTVMFTWKGRTFPTDVEVVSCAAARITDKKRAYAAYTKADGKCPNPADLDINAGFVVDGKEDIAGQQTYDRVDGVLAGDPILTCVNSTSPTPNPAAVPTPVDFPANIPEALPLFKGAGTATGVQKAANIIQFTTIDGFYASTVPESGQGVVGMGASFLSHDCIPDGKLNDYIASSQRFLTYNNGTGWDQGPAGYHCERGIRMENVGVLELQLMYYTSATNDTDCAPLANEAFRVDDTFEVIKELPGFPTDCASAAGRAVVAAAAALVAALALVFA